MLPLSTIKQQYPLHLQAFTGFLLREYLQYKILEIIARSEVASKLTFIGGTALRIVHGNTRFSEDLDFDNVDLTADEFAALADTIQQSLAGDGVVTEIRLTGKAAMRCDIRFPGLLFEEGLSPMPEQKILLQIDTLAQGVSYESEVVLLNKFDVFTNVRVAPLDILLSQKLHTCVNRARPKGRDFFDIMFLLAQGVRPNYHYLEQKLDLTTASQLREYILTKTATYDFSLLVTDVQKFLFNPTDGARLMQFRDLIQQVSLE